MTTNSMAGRGWGRTHEPLQYEEVPLPLPAAHDRLPAVPARELPDYVPSFTGRKIRLLQAWAKTEPAPLA